MPDAAPLVLGFDTSAAHCAAAVVSGGGVLGDGAGVQVLACRTLPMSRGQAEALMPLLEAVLRESGVDWPALSAIGVGVGPGNFTGIRISVAAARGLALALKVPAIGVTATEAAAAGHPRPCRAVVPLRGDEVVWEDFGTTPGAGPALAQAGTLPPGPAALTPRWPLPVGIALIAAGRLAHGAPLPRPAPLYLRPADAAPPRDAPPVLLA